MPDDEPQEPQAYITFRQDGQGWQLDTNVTAWQWYVLQIAAEIKKTL